MCAMHPGALLLVRGLRLLRVPAGRRLRRVRGRPGRTAGQGPRGAGSPGGCDGGPFGDRPARHLGSRLRAGDRVAVLGGGGPIGLFAVQWARIMGAAQIVAVDTSEAKAELARQAGATTALADPGQLAEVAGDGFDVVVETSGVPAVADQAVGAAGRHGDVVLIGIPNSAVQISDANWARLMRLEINIRGSWNSFSAPFPGAEWTTTLAKMASGDLAWEFMITHELGLDKVDDTISAMAPRSIHAVKVMFLPELTGR